MKTEIEKVNQIIKDLELISRFGGLCLNMQDKDLPYGIDGNGNTYSVDDYLGIQGYTYIAKIRESQMPGGGFKLTLGLKIFVSPKSVGELLPIYEVPMFVFQALKAKYKEIRFMNENTRKYSHYEISTIEIDMPVYSICDELELKSKIC